MKTTAVRMSNMKLILAEDMQGQAGVQTPCCRG